MMFVPLCAFLSLSLLLVTTRKRLLLERAKYNTQKQTKKPTKNVFQMLLKHFVMQ